MSNREQESGKPEQREKSIFLETALHAAKRAEEVILHYYSSDMQVTYKLDESPVTIADKRAEQVIIETIREQFPTHSILGEETGADSRYSDYKWIIDPIDGTKNYIRQIPLFATLIALQKEGELVLGVSNAPALRELMYAEKGGGAFLNGQKVHVSSIDRLVDAYMGFTSVKSFERGNLLPEFLALTNHTQTSRSFTDFWKYHLLAQGKIDGCVDVGTNIWDVAAPSIIIQEAGGRVTDLEGNPLTTTSRSHVATNGLLHKAVLQHFSKQILKI
jgi:histidinol-phosphatase